MGIRVTGISQGHYGKGSVKIFKSLVNSTNPSRGQFLREVVFCTSGSYEKTANLVRRS